MVDIKLHADSTLVEQCDEATEKGYNTLLAGDFNAEFGICSEFDDEQIIGLSSLPVCSDRGTWFGTGALSIGIRY